jgi:adenylyltransferase/sulfurtransferase
MATATLPETALPKLSNEEISRYSRHLILPEVGMEGQQKLKAAKVLCVGTGGLGAPLALYLAAAGVGTLGLVDFDTVDASNLQRQIIHSTKTVGMLKVDSAELMLKGLNPFMNVVKHNTMLTSANALEIFRDYDIIADGTDNFQTRYLVNDACVLSGNKPNAYGSIFRFEGQASVFASTRSRRRPAWCLPARRVACSAFCPASSASSRPPRSSSSSWESETVWPEDCCSSTRWA